MTSVPVPTVAPQDAWFMLTTGPVNPSQADSVPLAADLSYNSTTQTTGVVGALDNAVIFLAGLNSALDGGQKWLVWKATGVDTPDGVNVFCPFASTATPGRWVNAQSNVSSATIQTITANGQNIQPSSLATVLVVVNKSVGSATTLPLPNGVVNQAFTVKDGKGDAAANPITITAANIDGNTSIVIASNGGWLTLVWTGTQWVQTG